jgi:serine phosphatase RsbU (regulator of sigma subunit)
MRTLRLLIGHLPIRIKLALLTGVPVLGALVLSLLLASEAAQKAAKAKALGSVESLAELCAAMSDVSSSVHAERAWVALRLGRAAGARRLGTPAPAPAASEPFPATDRTVARLEAFLAARDESKLPTRLAERLARARSQLSAVRAAHPSFRNGEATLERVMAAYRGAVEGLVGATAALSELTDDGEVLRLITALVALQQLEERASQEHALLSYVFAAGEFPPGAYRELVTLLTEAATHREVLATNVTREQSALFASAFVGPEARKADALRQRALDSDDDTFGVEPDLWYRLQQSRVLRLRQADAELNRRVRSVALAKLGDARRAAGTGLGLAGAVVVVSLLLGWFIATGVSSSVRKLTDASHRLGSGDLTPRVGIEERDELGALGKAFETMAAEIASSRRALAEKARMARELEIAATIQRSILPPLPSHPEFQFAGRMIPADEVGGDFYDVLSDSSDASLWITIGDVSSHGLASGLVMMMTQAAFLSHFRAKPRLEPDAALAGVNSMLCEAVTERLKDDKYVTAQLLAYAGGGRFRCVGGHQSPLVFRARAGTTESVDVPGPWLGIRTALSELPVSSLELEVGDILCLYSDGLIESRGADGKLFELEGLHRALEVAARTHEDLGLVADRIMAAVGAHAASRDDDWTLLLVRRAPTDAQAQPPAAA